MSYLSKKEENSTCSSLTLLFENYAKLFLYCLYSCLEVYMYVGMYLLKKFRVTTDKTTQVNNISPTSSLEDWILGRILLELSAYSKYIIIFLGKIRPIFNAEK